MDNVFGINFGIKFADKHSYNDFGLILNSKSISPPEPKTYEVEIPGADGSIDLTQALTNEIKYKNRKLQFVFTVRGDRREQLSKLTEVSNYLHGQKMNIIMDDDIGYYYTGRAKVSSFESDLRVGTIIVDCIVDPYKYDHGDDWLWDGFDFETGFINEISDIEVSGETEVLFIGSRRHYIPWITCDSAMTVTFKGNTYNLKAGKNKIFDINIIEGENIFVFKGNGIVSIENKGGML